MEIAMELDPAQAGLAKEIAAAREALTDLALARAGDWSYAYELKAQARNGWSAGAIGLALSQLIEEGRFEVDGDRVRLVE